MKVLRWLGRLLGRGEDDAGTVETAEPPQDRPDRRRRSVPRSVTVGLDFGTSSTKVVFLDWTSPEGAPYAVDFDVDLPGYTRFSRPSLIALDDGRLLFGEEAAEAERRDEQTQVVRSAKVRLLDSRVETPSIALPWELPNSLAGRGVSALEGLVTLFLADTLRRALEAGSAIYPDLQPSEVAFNLDVPVDGLDASPVAERFQRMLNVAIPLASKVGGEMRVDEAFEQWAETLRQVEEDRPEEGDRLGELVPEAEAIIQGVGSALGSRSSDLYHAIVDIGAGTTDVAWFKLVETRAEDRLPFFAAGTRQVGCNDVDGRLAEHVVDGPRAVRRAVRPHLVKMKPDLISGEPCTAQFDGRSVRVEPEDLQKAAEDVAPEIYGHYSDMFKYAYKKEKNTRRWERIRTVVVGGGSLIPELRRPFEEHPRTFGEDVELIDLSTRMELRSVGASDRPPTREETPFLTAALGLAHPNAVMPEPIMPSDIDDEPPGPSGPTGLYDDEVDYW